MHPDHDTSAGVRRRQRRRLWTLRISTEVVVHPAQHARRRLLASPSPRLQPLLAEEAARCAACGRAQHGPALRASLRVCPACGHHDRVPAAERVLQIADPGTASPLCLPAALHAEPARIDAGSAETAYARQLQQARRSGVDESITLSRAAIGGSHCVLACMDFGFLGGSLGRAAGAIFAAGCSVAVAEERAVVAVCASGGARMQEGAAALAQMARCTAAVHDLHAARLPLVCILTDPCYGGVTASFAAQGDVLVAEPGARIGFAGRRVIEQATGERLPRDFQTAEFLLAHGMVDMVVHRADLRAVLCCVLTALTSRTRGQAARHDVLIGRSAWAIVAGA